MATVESLRTDCVLDDAAKAPEGERVEGGAMLGIVAMGGFDEGEGEIAEEIGTPEVWGRRGGEPLRHREEPRDLLLLIEGHARPTTHAPCRC